MSQSTHDSSNQPPRMKLCGSCKRSLPITHYAATYRSPDGHTTYCKECQRDTNRRNRIKKYGVRDPSRVKVFPHIMHVLHQIDHISELATGVDFKGVVYAFHLSTKEQFKVGITFSPDEMIVRVESLKDHSAKTFTYNGLSDYKPVLANLFKMLYLRPEVDYLSLCEVLTTIYW